MNGPGNAPAPDAKGGFCLVLVAVIALLMVMGRCSGDDETSAPAPPTGQSSIDRLKETYPRIPANGIRIPAESDLRNPDFDIGGHCLAEEKAGRGSFEDCLEVVGRELIAIGGPDRQ